MLARPQNVLHSSSYYYCEYYYWVANHMLDHSPSKMTLAMLDNPPSCLILLI